MAAYEIKAAGSIPANDGIGQLDLEHVFILIHGTWASKARWCKDDSELCRQIKFTFPRHKIRRFEWGGGNSVEARGQAAASLTSMLIALLSESPKSRYHLIAHSHGGNIAFYALRDFPDLQERIGTVTCLSTPFIYVQNGDASHRLHFFIAGLFLSAIIFMIGISTNLHPFILLSMFTIVLIGVMALFIGPNLSKRASGVMRLTNPLTCPTLIVRTAADEASGALMASQLGMWIIDKLTIVTLLPSYASRAIIDRISNSTCSNTRFGRVVILVLRLVGPLITVLLAIAYLGMIEAVLFSLFEETVEFIVSMSRKSELNFLAAILLANKVFPYALTLAFIMIISSILVGPALMSFVTGPILSLVYLYVDIYVEAAPPGIYTVAQFGLRSDLKSRVRTLLNHSVAYQSPEIIIEIVNWISKISKSHLPLLESSQKIQN